MKKKFSLRIWILGLCCLFVLGQSIGQDIKGTVTDAVNAEPMIGVTVSEEGFPANVAVSGLDGGFKIKLHTTSARLSFSYVGYKTLLLPTQDHHSPLVVPMQRNAAEATKDVVVYAQAHSEKQARGLERLSPNVINVVSARAIEISPDITVANVIQRVSGITIERNNTGDGQYALLRGMDKRYNYTLVNGIKIPSPDNKNRFVPLDIFPAEMLERLEVVKSMPASMEGDGIGGAINMVLKKAPEKWTVSGNLATGFNSLFLDKDFYSYDRSAINKTSPFEQYGAAYPAKTRDFNGAVINRQDQSFQPNLFAGLSTGGRLLKNKLGILLSGTYQNSRRGNEGVFFPYNTATSDASNLPVLTSKNERDFAETQTRAGIHAYLDYALNENHKLQLYGAWFDFSTQQVREEKKTDLSIGYDPANGNYNLSWDSRFRYTHQNIKTATLRGDHSFFNKSLHADWSVVYSNAFNETPENSMVHLVSTVHNDVENARSVVTLGGMERRWEHNTDEDKSAYVNLKYDIKGTRLPMHLAAGGMYRQRDRDNFYNQYDFRPFDESKPAGQQNNLIEGIDFNKYSEIKFAVFTPYGATGNPLNYSASEKIGAAYVSYAIEAQHWEALLGLRIENTDQGYHLQYPIQGVQNDGNQQYTDWLPSLQAKYMLSAKQQLRFSYYRAINRPSFFEIVPYRIINEEFTEAGNPDLKHTIADNLDLRYEWFPKPAEQLLAGIFYKRIQNPIEYGMMTQGQSTYYMPQNYGTATNYGVELDYTKYFHYFGVKLNYTYTNSSITTSKLLYKKNPDANAGGLLLTEQDDTRRLTGQAAHVANFSLLFKHNKAGLDAQLALGCTGNRLYAVSRFLGNDLWQAGFAQLDASAEKKLGKHYVLFVKAANLLNTPMKLYVENVNDYNNKVPEYETLNDGTVIRNDRYGITCTLGFRFKF